MTNAANSPATPTLYGLTSHLIEGGVNETLADLIGTAVRDLASIEARVVSEANEVIKRATAARDRILAHQNVNDLGELQSAGPGLDQACAARQLAMHHLKMLAHLLDEELRASTYLVAFGS